MRVDKIILKAFLQTFAAVLLLLGVMFGVLSAAFPQTMMQMTYDMGMDRSSVNFSVYAYKMHDRVEYIAYGADTALAAGLYSKADECLEKLVSDDDFNEYCNERNKTIPEDTKTTYQAYYFRQLCLSKYFNGNGNGAVDRAVALMGDTFTVGNPLTAVLAEARLDDNLATMQYIKSVMDTLSGKSYSADDQENFDKVYSTVSKWIS